MIESMSQAILTLYLGQTTWLPFERGEERRERESFRVAKLTHIYTVIYIHTNAYASLMWLSHRKQQQRGPRFDCIPAWCLLLLRLSHFHNNMQIELYSRFLLTFLLCIDSNTLTACLINSWFGLQLARLRGLFSQNGYRIPVRHLIIFVWRKYMK